MGEVITWIAANWMVIIATLLSIIGGASIIVKAIAPLTSSTKDDEVAGWLDKAAGWLAKIALNPPVK